MKAPLDRLLDWIDVESITGNEGSYGDVLARELGALGLEVERQELAPGRSNVLARTDKEPLVVFCTHLDTVPPFFGPSREGGLVRGRGACDAKGPALAMLEAARALLAEGEERVGFLFTCGEETDGAGAQLAEARRRAPWSPRWTIVGEPTDNRFVRGHKGVFKGVLRARGVAGHSSQPIGPSAVHELVQAVARMLADGWGEHPLFGRGTINFGQIQGGVAANVVAPHAEACLLVRVVEEPAAVRARVERALGPNVSFEPGKSYGPVAFVCPPGEEGPVVAFGTDAPFLPGWGERLLYGPGSIQDAHTAHEKLAADSFERGVHDYARVARMLLARHDAGEAGQGTPPARSARDARA